MATIDKRNGKYLARVRLKGVERSKTFRTFAEAREWATAVETGIFNKELGKVSSYMTFGDVIERYLREVTPLKKGVRSETIRLKRILRDPIAKITMQDLMPSHFSAWRDKRLKSVSEGTVLREMGNLSSICNYAMKEWAVINKNPLSMISKPKSPKPRTRRFSDAEITKLCLACDFDEEVEPKKVMQRVAVAMLFAIETAMRAGEICGLRPDDIDRNRRLAHLEDTKNGYSRDVPLNKRAFQLLELLMKSQDNDNYPIFNLTPQSLDANFRKAKDRAMIDDLHFHDTRREALTRMAKKVDVMLLAKISGHRDLRILQNTYYAPDMANIADLLD